jgi:hypothetical protein
MKHLRRFNEDLTKDEIQELKEFCESCLAYLLDEGFEIDYEKGTGDFHWIDLWGSLDESENPIAYTWDQVKDYYIPFIQLLKSRYKLVDSIIYVKVGAGQDLATSFANYTFDEVVNEQSKMPKTIYSLSVKVSDKK